MEPKRSSGTGSGNSGNYSREIAESIQFGEEIQSLITENILQPNFDSPAENGSSFTALLGLPTNQALELLHQPSSSKPPVIPATEIWRDQERDKKPAGFSFTCSPTFPSNTALVERAARFSIFASPEEAPATSSDPSNYTETSMKLKNEPVDSDSNLNSPPVITSPAISEQKRRPGKRKDGEKNKGKAPAKRSKNVEDGSPKAVSEKLPYVHVRARRGQATDSHSLAERARREKINDRMKLLQGLVPGCNKISGTALVLDEIINHVQSLQRQVELLSMRLAAVNPRIDSSSLDSFLSAECGSLATAGNVAGTEASVWHELQVNRGRRQQPQQQLGHVNLPTSLLWGKDDTDGFVNPDALLFSYESANSGVENGSLQKMGMKLHW